jgi:hypothetical protein
MQAAGKLKMITFTDRAADEEAARSGDGRLREGNRRRHDLQQDQFDVAVLGDRRKTSILRRSFLPPPRGKTSGDGMRKFIDGYYWLLNVCWAPASES